MKNRYRGYGFYLVLLLVIFAITIFSNNLKTDEVDNYNKSQFLEDIQGDSIAGIDIYQNEEVPTGEVEVTFDNETKARFPVADVKEIEQISIDAALNPVMHSMSNMSWLRYVVPAIISFALMMFLFSYLTNRAAGGGGNNNKVWILEKVKRE